jgi:hypothetical protein
MTAPAQGSSRTIAELIVKKMGMRKRLQRTGLSLIFVVVILLALLPTVILPAQAATGGTTSVTVTKYASDGTTVIAQVTVTYTQMKDHAYDLPVMGDGVTHYYHQGPVFIDDPDEATEQALRWNPAEDTNVQEKDYGALRGTNIADLCDLVGGMADGEELKVKARDGWSKMFAYKNVYDYSSREGPMVLTWEKNGLYPDTGYTEGMRLVWFADTGVNPWGIHAFGVWDWHEAADEKYWYYYLQGGEKYPTTTGLSGQYVSEIIIYSNEVPPTPTPMPTPTPTSTPTPTPTHTATPTTTPTYTVAPTVTPTLTPTSTPTPTSTSASTPMPMPTPTPTPTPATSGNVELKIDMWDNGEMSGDWTVNSLGVLQNDVSGSSLDGAMTISIANGTKVLDSTLFPLTQISVEPVEPPSDIPTGYHIIRSFNFAPDGAQFAPGITVIISFDTSGVTNGTVLVLAFYNETDGEWAFIEGTNNGDGTATFTVTHFSVYSLMYQGDSSGSVAPVQEGKGSSGNQLIAIAAVAAAAVLVIAIIILQLKRHRPARQQVQKSRKTAKTNRADRWN